MSFKNIRPKVLYLLHVSAEQWYAKCTLSYFSSLHSLQSCHCVSLSLNICALRVVWPVNSPTATLSFCLITAWSSLVLLGRGSFTRVLDWQQPSQFFPCWCVPLSNDSWWLLRLQQRGCQQAISRDSISPFLGQFISFFIYRYSMMPRYPY
jgi:hypothetical protein